MLSKLPSWQNLCDHKARLAALHLRDLFKIDSGRADKFFVQAEGLHFDFSKTHIDDESFADLIRLAEDANLENWRARMFSGEKINVSEDRAVLHVALRAEPTQKFEVDGEDIMPFVQNTLADMKRISDDVHAGRWTGFTGKKIKHVVNIGIGGSDLGPRMVCEALASYHVDDLNVYFVANVDGADIARVLSKCDPETTLFLIASKTFTTQETMKNAQSAKSWILSSLGDEASIENHFIALSRNIDAAREFGVSEGNILPLKDWVGGRFSLWSSVGLSICLAIGFGRFKELLSGAHKMDQHFYHAPLSENIPVILALTGIWHRNFWGMESVAVLPYAEPLSLFSSWLQQLDMESNGKRVSRKNEVLNDDTSPVVFGQSGTNGQHAFYQMLHQGTSIVPSEFIGFKDTDTDTDHHRLLLMNLVAQSQALAFGGTENKDDLAREFPGDRPNSVLILDKLTPESLGKLIALYEHKIFVQGVIWDINSFDQWGVELGKVLANELLRLDDKSLETAPLDSSTLSLLKHLNKTP